MAIRKIAQVLFVPLALYLAIALLGCSDAADEDSEDIDSETEDNGESSSAALTTTCEECKANMLSCPLNCEQWTAAGASCDGTWSGTCGGEFPHDLTPLGLGDIDLTNMVIAQMPGCTACDTR